VREKEDWESGREEEARSYESSGPSARLRKGEKKRTIIIWLEGSCGSDPKRMGKSNCVLGRVRKKTGKRRKPEMLESPLTPRKNSQKRGEKPSAVLLRGSKGLAFPANSFKRGSEQNKGQKRTFKKRVVSESRVVKQQRRVQHQPN